MSVPDPSPVIDLLDGFRRSKAMFAAVEMGIFDMLGGGPLSAAEIASRLKADECGVARLLETCAALGLLARHEGRFSNTDIAQVYLRRASDRSLAGYILYSTLVLYPCWSHLADAVREGTPRWSQTFGPEIPPGGRSIFEHFFSTEEKMRTFSLGMHGLGLTTSPAVVHAFDLSGYHVLADLGAATGHLAITACEAWPNLRGIVFDLAGVLPLAREHIEASGARDRIGAQAGDFFADELPRADLYALGRILHDWGEEKIRLLLRRIFDHLPRGGALLIAEKLLYEDRSGPPNALLQSLNMLVVTEGRERSLSEYTALLKDAGFSAIEGKRTGTYLDAILAKKE